MQTGVPQNCAAHPPSAPSSRPADRKADPQTPIANKTCANFHRAGRVMTPTQPINSLARKADFSANCSSEVAKPRP